MTLSSSRSPLSIFRHSCAVTKYSCTYFYGSVSETVPAPSQIDISNKHVHVTERVSAMPPRLSRPRVEVKHVTSTHTDKLHTDNKGITQQQRNSMLLNNPHPSWEPTRGDANLIPGVGGCHPTVRVAAGFSTISVHCG